MAIFICSSLKVLKVLQKISFFSVSLFSIFFLYFEKLVINIPPKNILFQSLKFVFASIMISYHQPKSNLLWFFLSSVCQQVYARSTFQLQTYKNFALCIVMISFIFFFFVLVSHVPFWLSWIMWGHRVVDRKLVSKNLNTLNSI